MAIPTQAADLMASQWLILNSNPRLAAVCMKMKITCDKMKKAVLK